MSLAAQIAAGFDRLAQAIVALQASGPGGGGTALSKASVAITTVKYGQATVTVSVPGATPAKAVLCQLAENNDWDADDLTAFSVIGVAGTDAITFTISGPGAIVGDFEITYQIG